MKGHNSSPPIYPYLVAEMIEADPHGSTIEAIAFMTREDLKDLKNKYLRRKKESAILNQAKESEKRIFAGLPPLERKEGMFTIPLLQWNKNSLQEIKKDIFFLFEHRLGKDYADELREIFDHDGDDLSVITLEYTTWDDGNGIIKKIWFKKK